MSTAVSSPRRLGGGDQVAGLGADQLGLGAVEQPGHHGPAPSVPDTAATSAARAAQ